MMKTKDLPAVTSALIEKMKTDEYSQSPFRGLYHRIKEKLRRRTLSTI